MALHAQRERLEPLEEQEGVQRGERRAGITQKDRADPRYKRRGAGRLGEAEAVVARARLGQAGEFSAFRPVEPAAVHNHAADRGAMAADELRRGMDDDVRAVLDRPQQVWCGKGRIDDERDAVPVRGGCGGFNVDQRRVRIADRLDKDSARPVVDGVFKGVFRGRIDKGGGDAVLRERVREQVVRAAVDGFGGDDVVARLREVEEGVGDRRRTGGYAERCGAAFERRDAFFKNLDRRVRQAAVDVAGVGKAEARGGVRGILKHIGGRLVDRHGARAGGGVRLLLTGVELDGFKTEVVVCIAHGQSLFQKINFGFAADGPRNAAPARIRPFLKLCRSILKKSLPMRLCLPA